MAIRVAPLRLALANRGWRGLELMAHQARALELASAPRLLLEAPTGGGKTWAGAVPLIDAATEQGDGAVFVYPTNALADDQAASLAGVLRRAGLVPGLVQADGSIDVRGADVLLWRAHAGAIDESQGRLGGRTRGQTISRVLERLPIKPLWIVTNPDTLYLLCTARYSLSPQLWSRLAVTHAMVLDEFHLYRGPTLVRALVMIELARHLLGVERVRVLSATLPDSIRSLLVDRFGFARIVAEPAADGRVVQHEVELTAEASRVEAATERIGAEILRNLPVLRSERGGDHVPLLVLRQSVLATIALEDSLVSRGLDRDEIGIYRGLSSRTVRSVDDKTVVLGTSALEVGVDFLTSRLVFEALSAVSFAQRLGRVGRHEPGTALFLTDARVAADLEAMGSCDRPALLARAAILLAADNELAGFATSPFCRAVAQGAFGALRDRGTALGAPDEFHRHVESVEADLYASLGVEELPPLTLLPRSGRLRLRSSVGFRGGEGSVEVFDVRERQRRGSSELAVYEVDLGTFYRRAIWADGSGAKGRPVVTGYSKPRRLSLTLALRSQVDTGIHAPRADQIQLRIDGAATRWETLLREREHLVGIFPAALRRELSWREDVLEGDDGRIALLDDDALIGAYIYWRQEERAAPA